MTKTDIDNLANAIKIAHQENFNLKGFTLLLARAYASDNSQFDSKKFIKDAGFSE